MREIFAKLLYEMEKGGDCVLVTIIGGSGSAPRKTGAQMLVTGRGRICGSVGGGAVEKAAEEIAISLITGKRSRVLKFDLDETGMICGGEITALFQFIPARDEGWNNVAKAAMKRFDEASPAVLTLKLDGGRATVTDAGEQADASNETFTMPLDIGERCVIFGAGHVALALVPILKSVAFRPVVFDDRPEYAVKERFPEAEDVVLGDFANIANSLTLAPDDYIVVMTSAHGHDFEVQLQALKMKQKYIGVMGSARKTAHVNERLMREGIPESRLKDVHTPIGTKIRAVTPAEIAVSIAGEMILVRAESREP